MVVGGYATRATGEPSVIKVSVFTCLSIEIELVLKWVNYKINLKMSYENKIGVMEMRILGLMCGKPRQDKIKNDNVREKVEKMVETRILWFRKI